MEDPLAARPPSRPQPPQPPRAQVGPAFVLFLGGVAPGFVGRSAWSIAPMAAGFVLYKSWTGRELWAGNVAAKGRGVIGPMIAATLVAQGLLVAALHGMGVLLAGDRGDLLPADGLGPMDLAWAGAVTSAAGLWAARREV